MMTRLPSVNKIKQRSGLTNALMSHDLCQLFNLTAPTAIPVALKLRRLTFTDAWLFYEKTMTGIPSVTCSNT